MHSDMEYLTSFYGLKKMIKRVINSRILKRWGSKYRKKLIWDKEFSNGQWKFLEITGDDEIYAFLEKYSNKGSILDLGCGSGNTGNEMAYSKYKSYTGVDISDIAIQIAEARTKKNLREKKNQYVCSDITSYAPKKIYDIILFRESIFYIPKYKICSVIDRYSRNLKNGGVFIVRMCDKKKYASIIGLIERHYKVLESSHAKADNIIVVFRCMNRTLLRDNAENCKIETMQK